MITLRLQYVETKQRTKVKNNLLDDTHECHSVGVMKLPANLSKFHSCLYVCVTFSLIQDNLWNCFKIEYILQRTYMTMPNFRTKWTFLNFIYLLILRQFLWHMWCQKVDRRRYSCSNASALIKFPHWWGREFEPGS